MGVDEHSHVLLLLAAKPWGLVKTLLTPSDLSLLQNSSRHDGHIGFIPHHHMVPH